jgi:hypothetical protein
MAIREQNYEGGSSDPKPGVTEPQPNAVSPFRRALEDFRDSLHSVWRATDATKRLTEVWQSEAIGMNPPINDYATYLEHAAAVHRRMQDAWVPPESKERMNSAWTEYVRNLKEACAKLDPETVHPADLARVAHSIYEASSLLQLPLDRRSKGSLS